ncbi:unnamed protein product [Phytomonas sp. Hart1]|nr:unnamed protein product [Phytomonas sp. Hart1]|eukprot:CCW71035.1 unnamed protein product [Phytomonas sp. isolate Hart1]
MSFRYGGPRRWGYTLDRDDVPMGGFVRILFCENGRVHSGFVMWPSDIHQKQPRPWPIRWIISIHRGNASGRIGGIHGINKKNNG